MGKPIVIIPARLRAVRLPNKPLLDIAGIPMIVHVWRRAVVANVGPVYVATDAPEIAELIAAAGGKAVMTGHHASGSDRVHDALLKADPDAIFDPVVNLQGDLPTIEPAFISSCIGALGEGADIGTLAAEIKEPSEVQDPNVVKAVGSEIPGGLLRALYFTRAAAPHGPGPHYHHIGIYAYRRNALARFVSLPPSLLEKRERLEQLRALEAGMTIHIAVVNTVPLGVDTEADLAKAREMLAV
ncbi:MAG TPA: 3-deoxy-manno-octulosonate cytidylyltransferase [Hyphomicrobiales bacterium]|nr:3-deoxy-manno-octulosonate cytidylyltransferase [Hyphomicrobiales bacterium]